MEIKEFIEKGLHLPKFMRDFHAQKDIFKAIAEVGRKVDGKFGEQFQIDWVTAHCYVIDRFLWFMAHHGYGLRKLDNKIEFDDLSATLKELEDRRLELLKDFLQPRTTPINPPGEPAELEWDSNRPKIAKAVREFYGDENKDAQS